MRSLKLILIAGWMLILFAVLHYTLPQTDVVRIVNTDIRRMDFGANAIFYSSEATASGNVDVRFIEGVDPDGDAAVFRNEDTGLGWPFYFKFDSADLQAKAADLISTRDDAVWVAVRHYGWRSRLLSAFPNATRIWRVDGPDVSFFPWLAVGVFVAIIVAMLALWRMSQLLWRNRIRPLFGGRGGKDV
ncbi:hypothetical protein PARPLA_00943 [Rhodobacteraceae bacterium THAF1]|uniref:DUF1523 family protein n=1 Tax=Palleronia sp. THAF1 TaxID=2587842 RepID=UPI000F403AB4|nr:DUF1523 family protein [Palleronia sp. THAF1]QFU07479.1 hypothetical protein FIU81_02190 [Palleronia sp. THAF1]VDC20416.1 hypothetical protein PARPLA_00943 [Rhodobacteraceae bacterium THAF1]